MYKCRSSKAEISGHSSWLVFYSSISSLDTIQSTVMELNAQANRIQGNLRVHNIYAVCDIWNVPTVELN